MLFESIRLKLNWQKFIYIICWHFTTIIYISPDLRKEIISSKLAKEFANEAVGLSS